MPYVRLQMVYDIFNIVLPKQVFKIDEKGIHTRIAGRGEKAGVRAGGLLNVVELQFAGNVEQVTIMLVVSADRRRWSPVVILQGVMNKFRVSPDGEKEFLHNYLPPDCAVALRNPAGMDSKMFLKWVLKFIEDTKPF